MRLTTRLPWDKANPLWASAINPLLANPVLQGVLIKDISLINGAVSINHGLGRTPQGWEIVDINAAATVYRSQPFNSATLTLTASATCTASIYVF